MVEGAGTAADHVAYQATRMTGSGELECCPRSCDARPESLVTPGNAAGADAQHIAVVTSGSCTKPAPPAQGDAVPG